MLELTIIAVIVLVCFWAGLKLGRHQSILALLGVTVGVLLVGALALQALATLYRDWGNLGASILLLFYVLPSSMGFACGSIVGCLPSKIGVR